MRPIQIEHDKEGGDFRGTPARMGWSAAQKQQRHQQVPRHNDAQNAQWS
jgi:hypothetical protein